MARDAQPQDPQDPQGPDPRRLTDAPPPPVSSRHQPRFTNEERKAQLADAFLTQGADYDHLRPGYPDPIIDRMLQASGAGPGNVAVDLGAGTGKLSLALAARGLTVHAVDPSEQMLAVAAQGTITAHVASAEDTGLPDASAHLVTAAQAWHWFDADGATREVRRLLAGPASALALVWNSLDVSIPWVHRYSRIMHAGDVHREDFRPDMGEGLELVDTMMHRWEDRRPTWDFVNLARTRSYAITATPERRAKVLDNLDWYLHDYQDHAPGSEMAMPYRTHLFVYRATGKR